MSPIYDVWYNTNYFIINAKPRKEFMKMLTIGQTIKVNHKI